ncbi:MAG: DNA primase [Steroidobacteraceae bacterium]|jgi:DNA primase|nr:DNA primase [Steroidobacteraceae bacterium]
MAGRIPQSFIDELIARTDIVEVVGSRVQLKKAGREWKACCPFHSEKTPSFWVSPDKQFYHCFGCGAHGTALGFLMEHDKLPFPDAVDELAGRLGLEVPREDDGRGPRERPGEDLYELLGQVTQYYRDCLRDAPRARDYLRRRGLTTETCVKFGIGYAPDAWDSVLRRFGGSPEKVQRLLEAGLVIERSGGRDAGHYDRFRDRVMFPIRDLRGRTIAFGGRIIDAGEPKYLNSPETPLFHKGRELYGLYEARQSLRSIDRLLVVEGYMDVVRLAQSGIAYSVATLGTATTPEHLNRLFRVCGEVVFCFDGDRAGRSAAWRALENSLAHAREGRQLRFLFLPEGQDPDSLVGGEGAEAFEARIAGAMPLSEYLVGELTAQVDLSSVDGRAKLAELARPLAQRVPEGVYRELLLERLAQDVRMPAGRLAQLLGLDEGQSPAPAPRDARRPMSAGRRPLLTQAILLVLHYPAAAKTVTDLAPLAALPIKGVEVLVELLRSAQAEPDLTTARLVERWRDRPEGGRLLELAGAESLVTDAAGAARELRTAVGKLISEHGPERRLDELIARSREHKLTAEEQQEFQALLKRRATPGRPPDSA